MFLELGNLIHMTLKWGAAASNNGVLEGTAAAQQMG